MPTVCQAAGGGLGGGGGRGAGAHPPRPGGRAADPPPAPRHGDQFGAEAVEAGQSAGEGREEYGAKDQPVEYGPEFPDGDLHTGHPSCALSKRYIRYARWIPARNLGYASIRPLRMAWSNSL